MSIDFTSYFPIFRETLIYQFYNPALDDDEIFTDTEQIEGEEKEVSTNSKTNTKQNNGMYF